MSPKRNKRPGHLDPKATQVNKDLSYVTRQGASKRRYRFSYATLSFLVPVFLAIALQAVGYLALYTRTAPHWPSAWTAVAVISAVPILTALTLGAFRRQESPILTAIAVTFIYFSFAITFLSALRTNVSFAGFAVALPFTVIFMAIANLRFHRRLTARVGLVTFDGQELPMSLLTDSKVVLITDPKMDISKFDAVLVDPNQHHTPAWSNILAKCYISGVDVMSWTRFLEIRHGRTHLPEFEIEQISYTPSQMLYARCKRFLDVCAVIVSLPLVIPMVAATALYILIRDGGPILFVQHRLGFAGRAFRVYKFRTMRNGTGGGATGKGDSRIIPGCHLIRRARIDELPQLYNILKGDMSLIGPRPEAMDLVKWYRREIPQWDYRMLVLPGLTGWAQVNSGYTSNPDEARVKLAYDLYYVKHVSFDLDVQILFKTVRTILFGVGAR